MKSSKGGRLSINVDEVQTERLLLRKPQSKDVIDILSIEGDPATNRYRPSGPMKDRKEAEETLEQWQIDWSRDGFGYWAVVLPRTQKMIGIGEIRRDHWQEQDILNLYYRFSPHAWGRGYATEVAQAAVEMARRYLPNVPFVARICPANTPSIRVV